jgi:hypothetical protein
LHLLFYARRIFCQSRLYFDIIRLNKQNIIKFCALYIEIKPMDMTQASNAAISPVQKEEVTQLNFPNEDVLTSAEACEKRRIALEKAVVLGNTYKGKTKIVFEDSTGIKQIETHIWGLTDKRVILKQGIVIPIHRIHEVKL